MWSDVFASPGWRTTGTQVANFLATPPGWTGTVPDGLIRIDASDDITGGAMKCSKSCSGRCSWGLFSPWRQGR
jgi:hypothetical protein